MIVLNSVVWYKTAAIFNIQKNIGYLMVVRCILTSYAVVYKYWVLNIIDNKQYVEYSYCLTASACFSLSPPLEILHHFSNDYSYVTKSHSTIYYNIYK